MTVWRSNGRQKNPSEAVFTVVRAYAARRDY